MRYLEQERNKESCEIFNLGTGNGNTVLEAIAAFEKASGTALNYEIGPRRAGDVIAIYANKDRANRYWDGKPNTIWNKSWLPPGNGSKN